MNRNRAWRRWFSTKLGVNTAIATFNAILIGVLWNAAFGLLQTEREDTIRAAIDRNDNLAVAFEQYTVRTLESANAVIRQLIRAYVSRHIWNSSRRTLPFGNWRMPSPVSLMSMSFPR